MDNIKSFVSSLPHRRRSTLATTIKSNGVPQADDGASRDEMFLRLRREAAEVVKREPILSMLLSNVGLLDASSFPQPFQTNEYYPPINPSSIEPAASFEEAVSRIVSHRLSSCSGGSENICPKYLTRLFINSFRDESTLEMGHTMSEAVREDAMAVLNRDPACETLLEAILFMKGFHSLVIHRAARRAWKPEFKEECGNGYHANTEQVKNGVESAPETNERISVTGQRFVALLLQSQASSAFGVDIHPACSIGAGVMIDHATGVVIGETATIGDGTTILHGVTLGGTGKDHGDRHPKIGKDVLIGAGTKILGNITVGDRAKIGAGSVVLRPIPSGATAVGAPAKIIGFTRQGERPGSSVDMKLEAVEPLLGKGLSSTLSSGSITEASTASAGSANGDAEVVDGKVKLERMEEASDVFTVTNKPAGDEVEEKDSGREDTESGETEEDDDNVTDFGTPAKVRWVNVSKNDDGLCPFSGSFRHVSTSIKQDTITHGKLRELLIQEGCTEGECVEVFFELLHRTPPASAARQCGCIPLDVFSRYLPEVAGEKTQLDRATILALSRGDLRALCMSKKASRRFKSVFSALGSQESCLLARIPSSEELESSNNQVPAMFKSERKNMESHLDTRSFAEGITM